jgi:hypothetical protein
MVTQSIATISKLSDTHYRSFNPSMRMKGYNATVGQDGYFLDLTTARAFLIGGSSPIRS